MGFISKRLAVVVLVVCFILVWRAGIDPDVAGAQGRKPVVITRIFTGPECLAHAEEIEVRKSARGATEMFKATGAEFSARAPPPGPAPATPPPAAPTIPVG